MDNMPPQELDVSGFDLALKVGKLLKKSIDRSACLALSMAKFEILNRCRWV